MPKTYSKEFVKKHKKRIRRVASITDYKLRQGKGLDRNQLGKYNLFHLR